MTAILYRFADAIRADSAGRTIFGTIVPYNTPAEVDDGYGRYREQFAPGAFTRSIAERGHKIRLFVQHDTRKMPIGRATDLREDGSGVHGSFAIARTRDGDDALELVTSGVADGFSVGFTGLRDTRAPDGTVTRTEAGLREVSLCHSPAYATATVSGVRSSVPLLSTDIARRRLDIFLESW